MHTQIKFSSYNKFISSPLSCEGTTGLDVPLVVFDGGKLEALGDLSHRHASFHILLIGKDQQSCLSQVLEAREETSTEKPR